MIRSRALSAACFALLLPVLGACASSGGGPRAPSQRDASGHDQDTPLILRERTLGVMGTELKITVLGRDPVHLESAIDAAVAEMRRIEDMMTSWRPSPLTRLNEAAGAGPQPVPRELAVLVTRSLEIGRLTGGAFDISFAGVGKLWDFKKRPPIVPTPETIRTALKAVDYRRVKANRAARTVTLPNGMRLGLGGIAKGYGVDRAMAVLMRRGIKHAFVNAGGDLKALGKKHGKPWRIAIKHPRDKERILAVLPVSNRCVLTSGDYERFFEHDGQRYHHILDPRTGYPSKGCIAATVVGPDAAFADALATALCVLSPNEGIAIVNSLSGIDAILVGMDGEVHTSSGLKESRKN